MRLQFLCALLVLAACSGTGGSNPGGGSGGSAGIGGSGGSGGSGGEATGGTGGAACVPDGMTLAPACTGDAGGAPFDTGRSGALPGALAGDFTLPTLSGDLVFSRAWTGCDSWIFVFYPPGNDAGAALQRSSFAALIHQSPPDVHYVFLSYATDATAARTDVTAFRTAADQAFGQLGKAARTYWEPRLHYVTAPAGSTGTWLSTLAAARSVLAAGVDRFQKIREVGLLDNVAQGSQSPELRFLANEAIYYDYEWLLERRHAADGARVVRPFDHVAAGDVQADVDLGDLTGVDALELDVKLTCPDGTDSSCGAWDYLDYLFLCDRDDSTKCDTELGRFITSYARGGRFSVDVSPLLALLQGGGARRMRFVSSNASFLTVDLRFRRTCQGTVPSQVIPLWNGGAFGAGYNDAHLPMDVQVPADARRVQLYAVVSGHGYGVEKANCAEFCNHEHHFTVGDSTFTLSHPDAGTPEGCMNHVKDGVTPDQYGTWMLGRGGWCPGWKVDPFAPDVTSVAAAGSTVHLGYSATVDGKPYVPEPSGGTTGFGARIDMNSWLVIWK